MSAACGVGDFADMATDIEHTAGQLQDSVF